MLKGRLNEFSHDLTDHDFAGVSAIFRENVELNINDHEPIKNATLEALMKIPAIQAELEFYSFLQQRFELQYSQFIEKGGSTVSQKMPLQLQ